MPSGRKSRDGRVRVRYRRDDGRFADTILDRLSVADVVAALPVREFRSHQGRLHYSGWYWSSSMSRLLAYESRLELARIMLADSDSSVATGFVCGIAGNLVLALAWRCAVGVRHDRDMPDMSRARLPDSDAARRVIDEVVSLLGPRIAARAHVQAEAVRPFLDRGNLRWRKKEAADLILNIRWARGGWVSLLAGFLPSRDAELLYNSLIPMEQALHRRLDALKVSIHPIEQALCPGLQAAGSGRYALGAAPTGELRLVIEELHKSLITLADSLTSSAPRPALPAQHPPGFARLHEHVAAETVTEELAMLIDEGARQYEEALSCEWPSASPERRWSERFRDSLDMFVTTDVRGRYETATRGFHHVEGLSGAGAVYRDIAYDIHPRIYSSYLTLAINYITEVLELMPSYAEASGQGKRRYPVTVYGNVGAINSEVSNSNLSVAATLTSIGATVEVVAGHGETDVAAAISALAEAIRQSPELAEEQRFQLLDNLADVADAAAAPSEPRSLSRAKAAMAMITTAASASIQLAQAVSDWHSVLGKFS